MTDHDDDVARRYRALPPEEPPSAIDAAILAHSRRAIAARPGKLRRWSRPLSIAAVLVLAVGIVSRMQVEQPGIETSAPAAIPPPPPAGPPAETAPQAKADMAAPQATPKPRAPARVEKRVAREVEAPPPAAQTAPAAAAPAPRANSFAADTAGEARVANLAVSPEAELERIAKLRAEGRDDEADRALETFRKQRPEYRIPDDVWTRVRPRQP